MPALYRLGVAYLAAVTGLALGDRALAATHTTTHTRTPSVRSLRPRVKAASLTNKAMKANKAAKTNKAAQAKTAQAVNTVKGQSATGQQIGGSTGSVPIPQVPGQIMYRKSGQRAYAVQFRVRGMHKSLLMPQQTAVASAVQLRYQGFSSHVHDLGTTGSFVHYGMAHWRLYSTYNNSTSAHQVATALRANGMSARVVQR